MSYVPNPKAAAPSGGIELRKAVRKKVLLTGKVIWDGGAHILDCSILDLSATGARITLSQSKVMPEKIILLDIANRMAHQATVVSERAGGFGLKFQASHKLADISAPELRYLKRIWMEAAR